jgi:hypothetical protein
VAVESQEYRARRASASGSFAAPLSASNSVSLVKTHPVMERVTCFTCGQKGHRSTECNGTSLSWEDQVRVREKMAVESQEYRAWRASASGSFAAPLSASNLVSLVKTHPVTERRMSGEASNASQDQPRILPVNNIQLVRMGNSQSTTAAFAMLHRIPGVLQAIKNAAMAVRHGQEEAGIGQDISNPSKLQRTDIGVDRDSANSPILQRTDIGVDRDTANSPAQRANDVNIPPAPVVMEQASPDTAQAAQDDMENLCRVISQEVDRAIRRVTMKDDTIIPPPEVTVRADGEVASVMYGGLAWYEEGGAEQGKRLCGEKHGGSGRGRRRKTV